MQCRIEELEEELEAERQSRARADKVFICANYTLIQLSQINPFTIKFTFFLVGTRHPAQGA